MEGSFDSWLPPPVDYRDHLQWNHSNWNKIGKEYVSTREVRESYYECIGGWPLLDEKHGVPKLLDRAQFSKYCYYTATMDEFLAEDSPDDYVPIGYEGDEASRQEWKEQQWSKRFKQRYFDQSVFDDLFARMRGEDPNPRVMVSSEKNQCYIFAVKTCSPDAIRAVFEKGTDGLDGICPNCLEGRAPHEREGVVAYALDNLYGANAGKFEGQHSKALECLRLVCSLNGVDVNADTWYVDAKVGPPLAQAIKKLDVEAVKILLDAGARPIFPEVVTINGQWATVKIPSEYPEYYQTGLHICTGANGSPTMGDDFKVKDLAMSKIIKLLLAAGKDEDVLVRVQIDPTDDEFKLSALDILICRSDSGEGDNFNYPLSRAVLEEVKARAEAGCEDGNDTDLDDVGYVPCNTPEALDNGSWAKITSLDDDMQRAVSRYMDIYDWGNMKQTGKSFKTWPKPPPPSIDYHLIMFILSDAFAVAYVGFATTLSGVLEACNSLEELYRQWGKELMHSWYLSLDVQFIRIEDAEAPVIPLARYKGSEYYKMCDNITEIHPYGEKHFGVEEAGKNLPKGSVAKKAMQMELNLSYEEVGEEESAGANLLTVDYNEAIVLWFDGLKPVKDVDLNHLWYTSTADEQEYEEFDQEIWINKSKGGGGGKFIIDGDGEWAICKMETSLYDPRC